MRMSRRKSEPLFKLADTVLCNFRGQLYDAIILEIKHVDMLKKEKTAVSEFEGSSGDPISIRSMSDEEDGTDWCDLYAYYLHYKNWNSSWDEWVRSDCLMSITEEARQTQLELKIAARKGKLKRTSSKKRRRRVGRKSNGSNLDEESSQGGKANETLESQEPMNDSISNVDDVCADEDEIMNEATEDLQAAENLDDSTNTCANMETEMSTPNENLSIEEFAVNEDKKLVLETSMEPQPQSISVEHPCSLIGTPTINDVLPQLQDYLCSIDSIGNVQGPAFVDKLRLMYEIFCKELVLPSAKYSAEQIMIANGYSAFGNVVHFSGLLKLISELESGGWSDMKYYNRLQEDEISYEIEDLLTIFHVCKEYFETTETFLQSI